MCHINKEAPGPVARTWVKNELFDLYWIGPGWIRNDSLETALIQCTHRDKSIHHFKMEPGDVLHADEDDRMIQITGFEKKEEK